MVCEAVPSGGVGSRGEMEVKDRVNIHGVLLSRSVKIDVGKDASVYGTLTAGHDVKVDQRSQIHDSITSGHRVEVKRDASVLGEHGHRLSFAEAEGMAEDP